ncbi:MAG: stalk domain-containing protein [Acidaminobacteraceae bacterium]
MKSLIVSGKHVLILTTMIFMIFMHSTSEASDSSINEIKFFVDGIEVNFLDQGPYIDENNRILVPVRFIVEVFGAQVKWEAKDRSVEIKHEKREKNIRLWINQREYTLNGRKNLMDTEAVVTKHGRTVVPVRFIAEALDIDVKWSVINNTGILHTFTKNQSDEEIQKIIKENSDNLFKPIFSENFTDKIMVGYNVADEKKKIVWTNDRVDRAGIIFDTYNTITENDTLLLGGSEKRQTLSLEEGNSILPRDYSLEFGLNVQSMSNAGLLKKPYENRPIIEIIPRVQDSTLDNYYSVVYYLENSEVHGLVANMFKSKWEIVRVNGGSIEVLDEGYYMLDEGTQYNSLLTIKNDVNGYVDISFYIDDPKRPGQREKPLLESKDVSPLRISKGMPNLSFRVGGFHTDGFDYTPIVELDDILVYGVKDYAIESFVGNSSSKKSEKSHSLELPSVISNGAIFQRNKLIPIWGRGINGEKIEVSFKKQKKTATVVDGNWYVEFEPESHGGPFTLKVKGHKKEIILDEIYIGEVFLVAGQSNAEWLVENSDDNESTVSNLLSKSEKKELLLHYFKPRQMISLTPNFSTKAQWLPAEEDYIRESSAIGTFFIEKILDLNEELKGVPIGIVDLAYGGSTIELFMPSSVKMTGYESRQNDDPIISGFWNGYMKALTPIKFKGVLFYQGENSIQLKYGYEILLRNFIMAMRTEFKDEELPFILVQLAGYGESYGDGDAWPIIRAIQYRTAKELDNVELVTAVDLSESDPWNIHPRKKKPIGERLAYKAMEMIYDKDFNYRSPEIRNYNIKDDKILLNFDYVSGSLSFLNGNVGDLEIVGDDKVWHKAKANIIEGKTLEVWSELVTKPLGVRYAYKNYPEVTIFDESNMPLLPFNTITSINREIESFTNDFELVLPYHGMNDWDSILNVTRNTFRTIKRKNVNTVTHTYSIPGQITGDTIDIFVRRGSRVLEKGSSSDILVIKDHNLKSGDLIRNTTRSYVRAKVIEIIDDDTVRVNAIDDQSFGDLIEVYKFRNEQIAN